MAVITDFISLMNRQHGFARSARYEVVLYPPKGINLPDHISRDVSLQCDTVVMPGHDLQTHSAKYGTGLATEMVNGHGFEGTIEATFYLDTNFETKSYFSLWQHAAINTATNKVSYYKKIDPIIGMETFSYAGTMEIYQLSSDYGGVKTVNSPFDGEHYTGKYEGYIDSGNPHKDAVKIRRNTREVGQMVTKRTYGMEVQEVYPETIGQIEYAYATVDAISLLPVSFQYKKWKTMDPTNLDDVASKFTRG